MSQEEETKCPDCGHMVRTVAGVLVAHDKEGLEPIGVGYWSGNNSEGVGHVRCLPKPKPYESFLTKKPVGTDWTPKLFWHEGDPDDDDFSLPSWELIAEIAGHRFGLAMVYPGLASKWIWQVEDCETGGEDLDAPGCVAALRTALPQWATVIPDFPTAR